MKYYVMLGLLLTVCFSTLASGKAEMLAEGNKAYHEAQYDTALKYYENYDATNPESAYSAFNKGATYYRMEDFETARSQFQDAAVKTTDLPLEARANYNLGNCAFAQAARQTDSNLQQAVDFYQESINFYKRAIELDPQLKGDAEYNIEITRLILKDLLDKLKQQQQQNEEQQQKIKEIVEKLLKLIDAEQQIIENSQVLNEEWQTAGISQSLRNSSRTLQKEQRTVRQGTADVAGDLDALLSEMQQGAAPQGQQSAQGQPSPQPLPEDNPLVTARSHVSRSANFQQLAENQLGAVNLADAVSTEQSAREELIKAVEALSQPQDQNQQQQQQEEEQQQQEEKQEQQAAAEDILDEEKENQDKREQQLQGGYSAPAKDW